MLRLSRHGCDKFLTLRPSISVSDPHSFASLARRKTYDHIEGQYYSNQWLDNGHQSQVNEADAWLPMSAADTLIHSAAFHECQPHFCHESCGRQSSPSTLQPFKTTNDFPLVFKDCSSQQGQGLCCLRACTISRLHEHCGHQPDKLLVEAFGPHSCQEPIDKPL